jgi:phosphate/sulfate permease
LNKFEFQGAVTAVAVTIGKGIVSPEFLDMNIVLAGTGAIIIWALLASRCGIPVSTTHCITTAIMGVGATRRLSAVRWGIARNIVLVWILTFPACGALGWLIASLLKIVV